MDDEDEDGKKLLSLKLKNHLFSNGILIKEDS
jgi:hypothetical protein